MGAGRLSPPGPLTLTTAIMYKRVMLSGKRYKTETESNGKLIGCGLLNTAICSDLERPRKIISLSRARIYILDA